jgi:hypothetical protein
MFDTRRTRPLDGETVAALRDLIAERGSRRLACMLGVPRETLDRAALGVPILAGNRELLRRGLERLHASREKLLTLELEGTP